MSIRGTSWKTDLVVRSHGTRCRHRFRAPWAPRPARAVLRAAAAQGRRSAPALAPQPGRSACRTAANRYTFSSADGTPHAQTSSGHTSHRPALAGDRPAGRRQEARHQPQPRRQPREVDQAAPFVFHGKDPLRHPPGADGQEGEAAARGHRRPHRPVQRNQHGVQHQDHGRGRQGDAQLQPGAPAHVKAGVHERGGRLKEAGQHHRRHDRRRPRRRPRPPSSERRLVLEQARGQADQQERRQDARERPAEDLRRVGLLGRLEHAGAPDHVQRRQAEGGDGQGHLVAQAVDADFRRAGECSRKKRSPFCRMKKHRPPGRNGRANRSSAPRHSRSGQAAPRQRLAQAQADAVRARWSRPRPSKCRPRPSGTRRSTRTHSTTRTTN